MNFSPKKKVTMRNVSRMLFLVAIFFVTHVFTEEVCKFEYLGLPELLDGDTIFVPVRTVAMSEYVRIGDPGDLIVVGNACSIMFLVDVSGSNAGSSGTDPDAERFDVMSAVIDTIYKKNPKVYVGLTYFGTNLWFNPSHDPVFIDTPGEKHGVIPLLQLDQMYNGHYVRLKFLSNDVAEQYDYTKAGIDVLKLYFRTQYINPWGIYPAYWADASQNGLTGINEGFTGTKHAMETTSPHSNDKQFIIFFSDGGATTGTEYTQALNTPTTFTIFYNPSSNSWQELQQFNANVQTNGFSTSNTMSNAWNMEMDKEILIKLIVDDILSQIITSMTTFISNDSVYINGLTGIKITEEGFCFEDLFPLKKYTDFHYEIDYHITKDSIASNGDTVTIAEYDSTVYVDYTVCVDDGDSLSDSIRLCWWDRDLAFYYNGDEIEEDEFITEVMDEIELRFSYKEVDTLYEYGDVMDTLQFELRSLIGGDVEEYSLTDQGSYWSCNIPREVETVSTGDGILQHIDGDSIIAIFRNGKLPLDTLRMGRIYDGVEAYMLTKAIYFDNSADGHVDSLYLGISGKDVDTYAKDIMDNITLPAHRNFSIGGYSVVTGGIAVDVTENAASTLTYCTDEDVIAVDSVELDPDVVLLSSEVDIIDSMAPVIMTADLQDSALAGARDELTVTFSENVESITREKPFKFYSIADDKTYDGTLGVISQSGASGVFEVLSLDGVSRIMDGDSIRIHWIYDSNVNDGLGNDQDNGNNIRREINVTVVEKGMKVEWGVYFDNTADGFVDSVFIKITGKKVADHVDDLMGLIELPSHRALTTNSYHYSTGGIAVDVQEKSGVELTMVDDRDVVVITKDQVFTDGESVIASEASIRDSIAPIIMKASYVDSLKTGARDELTIIFSENVEAVTPDKPFEFYNLGNGSEFFAILRVLGQSANRGVFEVLSIEGASAIENGDSIRIYWIYEANVYDVLDNNQDNKKNRRVEIAVNIIPDKYDLIPEALIYRVDNEYSMPANFYEIAELEEVLNNTAVGNGTHRGVTIITLRPDDTTKVTVDDSLSGKISIFDAVGNPIIVNRKLGFDKARTRLVYIWDGRNELGRHVGSSGYVAVMPCTFYYKGKFKWDLPAKSIVVGVKE